ncbi:MAG: M48 family metallopeptidase [Balneolales bacterium]
MNTYAIVILAALLTDYILNLTAGALNLKSLKQGLPGEFEGIYDKKEYQRSQSYTRERTRFGFLASTISLGLILAFWFSGGFNYLDQLVRAWDLGTIATGLFYIGILMLAQSLLSLPFSLYSTFVMEEKYGFNKTTVSTFTADLAKGLLLSALLGLPLLAGIIWFFEFAGMYAWIYAWGAAALFILAIQFIAPTWIMPLFNKFSPLEDGDLKEAIMNYAQSVNFPLQGLYVMDGSKRSTKSNAFFTGFGKNKRIALFDTLTEKHPVPELVAVLAHEIGHYKKKHIQKSMMISVIHMGVMFALLQFFLTSQGLYEAFFMEEASVYAGLIFFGMLYAPVEMILSIFMQLFSRKNEYEADRFAAETTGEPEQMVKALKKLSVDNLSNLTPHPVFVFLNYSHPPVMDRIAALRKLRSEDLSGSET